MKYQVFICSSYFDRWTVSPGPSPKPFHECPDFDTKELALDWCKQQLVCDEIVEPWDKSVNMAYWRETLGLNLNRDVIKHFRGERKSCVPMHIKAETSIWKRN